jgi:predicted unusual protein kinase regulating ubiquinone biosynthesis (AarF/ABC1/UbiB family)
LLLRPKYLSRARNVASILIGHGFEDVLAAVDLGRLVPWRKRPRPRPVERAQERAKHLRLALEELGSTYIKLGQLLSSRSDLLPPIYIEELSKLQDQVESFEFASIKKVLESELGEPLSQVFEEIDDQAVASASLAQVHRARLRPGLWAGGPAEVAVKVLKPGLEAEVEVDLAIVKEVARAISRSSFGRQYNFVGVASQLENTLTSEMDLRNEARNAEGLRVSLKEFTRLRIPLVLSPLTKRRVLISEYIHGSRLAEIGADRRPELADELWRGYLKQILVDGAFHCDPHPGNVLIDERGRIVLLDHGMVAFLSRETQLRLMALLLALADRDGDRVAEACVEIGIPGPQFRLREFKEEVGVLAARYAGFTMGALPLGRVVQSLVVISFHHHIRIPSEMMLLGKALLNLEPICRQLDPEMDPVATMREMAVSLLGQQISKDLNAPRLLAAGLELRSLLNEVPANLRRILGRASSNELRVGIQMDKADEMQAAIQKVASRITLGLITAALIVGSALLLNVEAGFRLWGYPLFALVGFVLAAGLGLYVVGKIILLDKL